MARVKYMAKIIFKKSAKTFQNVTVFTITYIGKLDIYVQKNEFEPLIMIDKRQLKMDEILKYSS
jgi:hypothetical protein